jgi:hypothetical protein
VLRRVLTDFPLVKDQVPGGSARVADVAAAGTVKVIVVLAVHPGSPPAAVAVVARTTLSPAGTGMVVAFALTCTFRTKAPTR